MDTFRFKSRLNENILNVLNHIIDSGGTPLLVGGVVRDFLLWDNISNDIDIEVHFKNLSDADLLSKWSSIKRSLMLKFNVTSRPMNIIKITFDNCELDLSLPRLEIYDDSKKGHSNFVPQFFSNLDYEESFKRRDLSINSMAVEFNQNEMFFVDPYNGLEDLKNKKIRLLSEDFANDPVRGLRAIRFSIKYQFEMDVFVVDALKSMSFEHVTLFYIENEMRKSGRPLTFLKEISKLECTHKELNVLFQFENIKIENETNYQFYSISEMWSCMLLVMLSMNVSITTVREVGRVVQVPLKILKRIEQGYLLLNESANFKWIDKDFIHLIGEKSFNDLFVLATLFKKYSQIFSHPFVRTYGVPMVKVEITNAIRAYVDDKNIGFHFEYEDKFLKYRNHYQFYLGLLNEYRS